MFVAYFQADIGKVSTNCRILGVIHQCYLFVAINFNVSYLDQTLFYKFKTGFPMLLALAPPRMGPAIQGMTFDISG